MIQQQPVILQPLHCALENARLAAVHETAPTLQLFYYWCRLPYTAAANRDFIKNTIEATAAKKILHLAIVDRHTGDYLGETGYDWTSGGQGDANIFYWIKTTAQRKGYAATALCRLIGLLKNTTSLRRAVIKIPLENIASKKVALSAGAVYSSTLTGIIMPSGRCETIECYTISLRSADS